MTTMLGSASFAGSSLLIGLTLVALVGCGGAIERTSTDTSEPAPAPIDRSPPSQPPPPTSGPATPPAPPQVPPSTPQAGSATATRDGSTLYLSMCHELTADQRLHVWGEVTDPAFVVDEAIISFTVNPRTSVGTIPCHATGTGVAVVFAEARGAEFDADPAVCSFTLTDNASTSGVARGHVAAEYADELGARHKFEVSFAVPACKK